MERFSVRPLSLRVSNPKVGGSNPPPATKRAWSEDRSLGVPLAYVRVLPGVPPGRTVGTFGLVHRTEFVGHSSRATNVFAASACMPGRTCWYVAMVNPGVECPNHSLTTLIGIPALRSRVAW